MQKAKKERTIALITPIFVLFFQTYIPSKGHKRKVAKVALKVTKLTRYPLPTSDNAREEAITRVNTEID